MNNMNTLIRRVESIDRAIGVHIEHCEHAPSTRVDVPANLGLWGSDMKRNQGGRPVIGPVIRFRADEQDSFDARKFASARKMTLAKYMREVLKRAIAWERSQEARNG